MAETLPSVAVIVLSWNRSAWTLECLDSLSGSNYPPDRMRVLVVDNGSSDGSVEAIRVHHPGISILENSRNLGYAAGNNVGIEHALQSADTRYLLLLNNDVRLAPDAMRCLVLAAEQFEDAAFLGPKVYDWDRPDHIQSAGATIDSLWRSRQRGLGELDTGQFDLLEEVDYVIGAAVLVRAEAVNKVGLLDPDFYLYREDVDWCFRARRLGYRTLYVPEARVWHRSHRVRSDELPRITYYRTRNSLLLLRKRRGGLWRAAAVLLRHLLTALTWTLKPRWRHKQAERDALLRGVVDFIRGKVGAGYA